MTMFNFNDCKNATAVKGKAREIGFTAMLEHFVTLYGEDNVSIVGNSEIAVCVGTRTLADGTEGEVCFTVKPVAKDFDIRKTDSGKVFQPYERVKEADVYEVTKTEKERKAEENARIKAEKKARDEKARAERKAKAKAEKGD